MRILRGTFHADVTVPRIAQIDLETKQAPRRPGSEEHAAAMRRIQDLWRLLLDVGAGELRRDSLGIVFLRKFRRDGLSKATLGWLQQNRIPGSVFGLAAAAKSVEPTGGTEFRNTNPSVTVHAMKPTPDKHPVDHGLPGPAPPSPLSYAAPTSLPTTSAAIASHQQAARNPQLETLFCEVISGAVLDARGARQRVRNEFSTRNIVAHVHDVKPLRHERYYKFKAECLRCTAENENPKSFVATYYRINAGQPAKTLHIGSHGEHDHDPAAPADAAAVFSPQQLQIAEQYLLCRGTLNVKGLTDYLAAQGHEPHCQPPKPQRQQWLDNRKRSGGAHAIRPTLFDR